MADARDDVVLRRALDAATRLPAPDPAAVARIAAAAASAREAAPADEDLLMARPRTVRVPLAGAIAVAAAAIGFVLGARALAHRGPERTAVERTTVASPSSAAPAAEGTPVVAAGRDASADAAVPTTFLLERAGARHVLLVGDFSGWEARAIPLVREGNASLWSATVPLPPGRHVYAFLVDSTWTVDPRAPATRDPDFGVRESVVLVGR